MNMTLTRYALLLSLTWSLCALVGCAKEPLEPDEGQEEEEDIERAEGWDDTTHSKDAEPNYELLFDDTKVHTLHITIAATDFAEMTADIETLLGVSTQPGGRPSGRPGEGGGLDLVSDDPMYVPVTIEYEGVAWEHVGMRYKGNSTLSGAYSAGSQKFPFRLNFDYWEDEFPEIKNQRFHGFDKMTFASGYNDDSNLRDTLAAEIFRANGIPAARTAFYRIVVDTGDGGVYWGLYTMIEDPSDDPMMAREFGSTDGNMYKPESDWTAFTEETFEKKNNEEDMDYSDVEAAVEALHADLEPEAWRDGLEAHFNVDAFLYWLAINTVMQNWDVYGALAHNYYLYGDPADSGRLVWIPWDHNEALNVDRMARGGASSPFDELMHTDAGTAWPLISRLLADDHYGAVYEVYVLEALEGPLDIETFSARARTLHTLIAPHMIGDGGELGSHTNLRSEAAFEGAVDDLIGHVQSRHELVIDALGEGQ